MEAIRILKGNGYRLAALELTDRSVDYRSLPYSHPFGIILGHEVAGVTRPLLENADYIVEIPLIGRKNSLNVATACGVVLFEILRQWGIGGGEPDGPEHDGGERGGDERGDDCDGGAAARDRSGEGGEVG